MRKTLISMLRIDDAETAFQNIFDKFKNALTVDDYVNCLAQNTVFLFRGGQDIHPSLYGEKRAYENQSTSLLSERDCFELEAFKFAKKMGIPMLGICRGSQFLCAASGGKLVQHVENHNCGHHEILSVIGKSYDATSTHHQMMYPWPVKHKLLAWATPTRSTRYVMNPTEVVKSLIAEPEIVFFPETKALSIQGHPEYLTQTHPFTVYCNQLVKDYLL